MVLVEGVTKRFGEKTVLSDINLKLPMGQTHIFLGESGSGKSTLLKMIAGLLRRDTGKIEVEELKVLDSTQRDLAKKMGYVIQEGGLFPHLSAKDNVTLMAKLEGWDSAKIEARVKELAELVNLELAMLDRFPKGLSGGQRQRVSLMRALMLDPDILLLDEPLGALDPITRSELQEQLKDIFARLKKTVLIVTHDLGEAAFFGDTISLLHQGQVLQHGSFDSLVNEPAGDYVVQFLAAQRPVPLMQELM